MNKHNHTYTTLCTLFSVLIITGNLIYQKFIFLPIFSFYTFELSVGAILYPLTFLITDLISEFYGKEKANFCVRLAIIMNILVAFVVAGADQFETTNWSKIDKINFHTVFGLYHVAFVGSLIACYISQLIDIQIYLWILKVTKGKWIWVRNIGSTSISLFIDTFIIINVMVAFRIFSPDHLWDLIINSYLFKLFFSICSIPLFYIFVTIIKKGEKIKIS